MPNINDMTNARKKRGSTMHYFRFILAYLSCIHYSCVVGTKIKAPATNGTNGFDKNAIQPHQLARGTMILENQIDAGSCLSEIYSCRGRCNVAPRFACSCHHTCQIYGNCCEDYAEICDSSSTAAEAAGNFPTPEDVTVKCIANSFLISSCSGEFVQSLNQKASAALQEKGGQNIYHNTLMTQILDSGFSEDDVLSHCFQENKTNRIAIQSPVTDRQTQLHYKNVFCAACNNASTVEFWDAFIKCNHVFESAGNNKSDSSITTRSPLSSSTSGGGTHSQMEGVESKMVVLAHDACTTTWLPTSGATNGCFKDADLRHNVTVMENNQLVPGLDLHNHTALSLDLDWQDVDTSSDDVNVTEVNKKCQELTSYVEFPSGSGNVYKNKYCYIAHHNHSGQGLQFCEPDIKVVDGGERWFALKRRENPEGDVTWLDDSAWDLTDGIDKAEKDKLVHAEPGCDMSTSFIENGTCYQRLFLLRIKVEFTFKRSSVIKGDFNEQVESYSSLLEDETVGYTLNDTFCITLYTRRYRSETNSHKYNSETEFACAKRNQEAPNKNSNLATSDSNLEIDVNIYKNFVTNVLNNVLSTKSVIKVPVTIKTIPCIFVVVESVTSMHGFCSEMASEWRIERNVNAIIGGISLEGIITIICCVLSDIGLLVRLALQNVVPFYKSYPGKIQFNLCLSLLFAYTLFMVGGAVDEGTMICKVIAILTHLAFLSALFWMNVTAFEIWRTFRHWRNQVVSRGFVSLVLSVFYAVGIPILYVVTALILENVTPTSDLSPAYGEHYCWLNGSMAVAFFFVIPCSFICCMNIVFVGLTLRGLRRQRTSISEFKKSNAKTAVTDTTIVVKIILLVGITWLLGLLAAFVDHQVLWIIFTIINASLGFMISCVLVINKRVYYAVQNKCLCYTVESTAVVSTQVPRH